MVTWNSLYSFKVGMQLCLWLFHVCIFIYFSVATWNSLYSSTVGMQLCLWLISCVYIYLFFSCHIEEPLFIRGWYTTLLMAISCVLFICFSVAPVGAGIFFGLILIRFSHRRLVYFMRVNFKLVKKISIRTNR